jgi:hypothetical protein
MINDSDSDFQVEVQSELRCTGRQSGRLGADDGSIKIDDSEIKLKFGVKVQAQFFHN